MSKPVLKWAPAHPIRAKDNLISSSAREKNQVGFKPSYDTESRQQMNYLMSHEYMKMWYKERGQYEKDVYSREETIKEESKIKRRVVQRMMTYRRPLKNDFIDEFIQKKKGNLPEQVVSPEKMKYRPDCYHKKGGDKNKSKPQDTSSEAKHTAAQASKDPLKQDKKNADEKKGTKGQREAKGHKNVQRQAEHLGKAGKGSDDDECDVSGEILLVCADTENKGENKCCECKNK